MGNINIKERVFTIVVEKLVELGEEKNSEELIKAGMETKLYGKQGTLNSLALVRLAVEIEEAISDEFEKDITIVDERAMSQNRSPFRDVESLVNYLVLLVEEVNS